MSHKSTQLFKAALSALYYTGADGLAAPFTRGQGVIFMLHRVTPEPVAPFEPNRILKVTPDFLSDVIRQIIEAGFDLLSLDEVPQRLASAPTARPFACFTLDDGYRDNLQHALPVFKRYGAPFTVYVPTDYIDGNGNLWWLVLERVIRQSDALALTMNGSERRFETTTTATKDFAYSEIYWWLRRLPEADARAVVGELADRVGIDVGAMCRQMMMNWEELRTLATDPLVTIGAHTRSHMALAKLDAHAARDEIAGSITRIESELGRPCHHFSYPYGCKLSAGPREFAMARELGVKTAVTTRKGLLDPAHADRLAELPRFSLNGDFQDPRYIKVILSGVPFRLWSAFGRVTGAKVAD